MYWTLKLTIACFKQKWCADVTDSRILYDKYIKTTFGYEQYLDKILNSKLRSALTKFRISAHNLRVDMVEIDWKEMNEKMCYVPTLMIMNMSSIL